MFGQVRLARFLAQMQVWLRDRFGLLWLVLAAILVFGATGFVKVTFDDALLRFFKSDFAAYDDFVDVAGDFESDSGDVIILIEADDLADPTVLGAVNDFLLDAQFVDGVRAAMSPFSLDVVGDDGTRAPLVPYPLPGQADMAARFNAALATDGALRRLMAPDRTAMMVILPIDDRGALGDGRAGQIDALLDLTARAQAASGASFRLTGYPVLRDRVSRGLLKDVLFLNLVGAIVGFAVASFALRSIALGVLTLAGPLVSLLVVMGTFGHLGIAVNTMSVTLPVLVLVLATSDSIHLCFERARQAGRDSRRATLRAVRRIAIACIFASVTTAIAFGALTMSRAEIISELGRMGALLVLMSVGVVLLTQTLVLTMAGHVPWLNNKFDRLEAQPPTGFGFALLPKLALARPRAVTAAGLVLLAFSSYFYTQAGPRYSILDSLNRDDPVIAAFDAIEAKIAPVSVLNVAVRSTDPAVISALQDTVAAAAGRDTVRSVADYGGAAKAGDLPEILASRLVSEDGTRALVTLSFRYENGVETMALADRIDAAVAANPALEGQDISPATGLPVMTARVADRVLTDLVYSLVVALAAVGVLIAVWLRSVRIALIALIPNVLPVTIIGGWLALSGQGIEFANGMALTVAFGVAVDDTLHVLNRLRLMDGVQRIDKDRLRAALKEVTPALVTTSGVLVFGIAGSLFAQTRGVVEFGQIAMSVYVLALFADLLVLPAALATFGPKTYLSRRRDEI